SIVNPKQLTAQQIVQYVRAAGNSMESNVETLYRLMNGRVEALEFLLDSKSSLIGTKLADMRIKKNVLIAGIVREGKLIIPGGQDAFQAGDTVIVVTTNLGFHEIENILA
ncbi:TrkA C-terminal domain-containing protein, partial [Acidaminococcus fermentans]